MTPSLKDAAERLANILVEDDRDAIPIRVVSALAYQSDAERYATPAHKAWLQSTGWRAKPGNHALLPGESGSLSVLFLTADEGDPAFDTLAIGALPAALPEGTYTLSGVADAAKHAAVFGWLLGGYAFDQYISTKRKPRKLVASGSLARQAVADASAIWLARDLINTPANDLGPPDLARALVALGTEFGAQVEVTSGDDLLTANFPMIHTVGRASDRPPCLADLRWGNPTHPKVTLVGKGICFDTGGLNMKPPQAMALMKKDMGGAASVMALGAMIMSANLPVRLRILIAAADNNISANAFRPGDILKSRAGMTVEIGNTDAEGRLVLADALSLADEEAPDLLIDIATLTGAARVALGPDLSPFYTDDEALARVVHVAGMRVSDPVWRMPFWAPYDGYLKSKVADVNHIYNGPFAGSITAALFLKRFVKNARRFVHFDIYGWTPRALPGKPMGGEPQGARVLFKVIRNEFGGAQHDQA